MSPKEAIAQVARNNGVSYEEVYADIKEMILDGYHNKDPEVQKMWSRIHIAGEEPTPEEVIMGLTLILSEQNGMSN